MNLSIIHYPKMKRCWLIKREYGEYEQHAHFYTKEEALICRKLIDSNKYPRQKKYIVAMKRLLTDKEFSKLQKKQRYFNIQKGVK